MNFIHVAVEILHFSSSSLWVVICIFSLDFNNYLKICQLHKIVQKRIFYDIFFSVFGVLGRRLRDSEVIDIAVEATLDEFAVALCTHDTLVTDLKVKGVAVQKSKTVIEAKLDTTHPQRPRILRWEWMGTSFLVPIVKYNTHAGQGRFFTSFHINYLVCTIVLVLQIIK